MEKILDIKINEKTLEVFNVEGIVKDKRFRLVIKHPKIETITEDFYMERNLKDRINSEVMGTTDTALFRNTMKWICS